MIDDLAHSSRCGADDSPYCPWWCEVHQEHHPVPSLVDLCEEKATDPVGVSRLSVSKRRAG